MKCRSMTMHIQLITPTLPSRKGNWITAMRWARILRQLGHRVEVRQEYVGDGCEVLIALHARKSFASIERFHREQPDRPLVLTLTGTDLYHDIRQSRDARRAMDWADRLILLQPEGNAELAPGLQHKTLVIRQSAVPTSARVAKTKRWFDVCVVGHLRPVKDPFRTAAAARLLPSSSRIRVLQAGAALSGEMATQARTEMAENRRYKWLGDRPRWQVRRLMAKSRLMVLSSKMEGGANVVSEALVAHLPVLSTEISGSIGMLGEDHLGYFQVGDTAGLVCLAHPMRDGPCLLAATGGSQPRAGAALRSRPRRGGVGGSPEGAPSMTVGRWPPRWGKPHPTQQNEA